MAENKSLIDRTFGDNNFCLMLAWLVGMLALFFEAKWYMYLPAFILSTIFWLYTNLNDLGK